MSYAMAMEQAGAKILAFDTFGSYQGDWLAIVEYDGKRLLIAGSFGSCSGCDAFEAEFDCIDHDHPDGGWVYSPDSSDFGLETCEACAELKRKLAEFGRSYLDDPHDFNVERTRLVKDSEWDSDAHEEIAWLDANRHLLEIES